MSFLIEVARPAARATIPHLAVATQAPRTFTTSIAHHKSATQNVKDGLKSVDRVVSDKVVHGIDAAVSAGSKLKKESRKMTGKGMDYTEDATEEARSAAREAERKAKNAAEAAGQKTRNAADDMKRKL